MPHILGPAPPPRPLRVAVLVTPATNASTACGMVDLFSGVGRSYERLTGEDPTAVSLIDARLVTLDGGEAAVSNGIVLAATLPISAYAPGTGTCADLVCVASLAVPADQPVGAPPAVCAWLRQCLAAGSVVASACSGALLLAEAGLLDGGEATTHWGYCAALRQRHPAVRVCPERVLVATGPGGRVVTAGGSASWYDLVLYLVDRFLGAERARRAAKLNLLQWHVAGQLPFASLSATAQHGDRAIRAAQDWLAENYRAPHSIASMLSRSGLPERSFQRRFRAATGLSPLDYVHALRIEEAKQMLETTEMAVDAIADEVGYEDPAFFRRLFRRHVALTPAAYRRAFARPAPTLNHSRGSGMSRDEPEPAPKTS
ncbi:GlxA family transcriptional regulator [Falsiroseomonas sp. E2-1-a20]|uniref:GlxA family transcriptional regulator n=1 Tax=Falsiroseomonas sp. E2-1-a20 TaxID=3239300 RepID=UPI003F3D3E12